MSMKLPQVVPPLSVFRKKKSGPRPQATGLPPSPIFRIGYYSPQDGLACIWLVDEDGEYCQTVDRTYLEKYFEALLISDEEDYFGKNRQTISKLSDDERQKFLLKT